MTELESRHVAPLGMLTAPIHVNPNSYLQACLQHPRSTRLQEIIQQTMLPPSVAIAQIETLPDHLHPINVLHLSNGSRLALKAGPSSIAHLLRHERCMLDNEAATLQVLARSSLPIPRLFKHDQSSTRIGSPFVLITFLPGTPYAEEQKCMNASECTDIEHQLKLLTAAIGQYVGPSPIFFGPVAMDAAKQATWREAFKEMLESVLMDGEDLLVYLPYAQIRDEFARLAALLNDVREPRLVVLGLSEPRNVLIDRQSNSITGLLDFGRALWGDWQMGAVEEASVGKRLLYTVYHTVVAIVTCHYRRQNGDDELDARKALTHALEQLCTIELQ
ncbi:MAG: hypothetical protein L6R35_004348 [Caloplaca aegaea]|nr:MAG: hypothetical protein L6R35_004348 [Caloplaca aegaea]